MIDPVAVMKHTGSLLIPTSSKTGHVAPLPTVKPTLPVYEVASETGTRTLWVVFVLMTLSTIVFAGLAYRVPVQKRLFHILTAFITTFAAISYFAMATNDGSSLVSYVIKETHKHGIPDQENVVYRAVYWARYVDWSVTTPLLLMDLAFLAGLNGANMVVIIVADVIMILTGLFAAFGQTESQRWGYYTMACMAYLVVIYQLAVAGRRHAMARDAKTSKLFHAIALFTLIIWTGYPIVWGVTEGARRAGVDAEIIAYAILDILAKPVFGFWLLLSHEVLETTNLHLEGAWTHGFGKREGALRVGDDDEGA